MNTYSIEDENFINSDTYKKFIEENPTYGYLNIRAFTANQAVPIANLKITIKKVIDNNNVIFFDGYTNSSGVIEMISLPAPKLSSNDLNTPNKSTYEIIAISSNNISRVYNVNIYEDVLVIQNINLPPNMNISIEGDI